MVEKYKLVVYMQKKKMTNYIYNTNGLRMS